MWGNVPSIILNFWRGFEDIRKLFVTTWGWIFGLRKIIEFLLSSFTFALLKCTSKIKVLSTQNFEANISRRKATLWSQSHKSPTHFKFKNMKCAFQHTNSLKFPLLSSTSFPFTLVYTRYRLLKWIGSVERDYEWMRDENNTRKPHAEMPICVQRHKIGDSRFFLELFIWLQDAILLLHVLLRIPISAIFFFKSKLSWVWGYERRQTHE